MDLRNFYRSTVGFNTATIRCKTGTDSFDLNYHLYDNPIQHAWQGIHLKDGSVRGCYFNLMSLDELYTELKQCCEQVDITNFPKTFDQKFFSQLHHQFVLSDCNGAWQCINDLIHVIERKIENPFADYDTTIKFYAQKEETIKIEEEHKIFLDTDIKWGRMNLGYATLGKDWIDISIDNDDSNLDDLAIQSYITSETNLSFCVEPGFPGKNVLRFHEWSKSKHYVPKNNLNKLALGRYPLGQLIITDSLLDFHSNASDWYVPNHECKLMWNKTIFKTIEIESINFSNTDLLFESFLKHSNLSKIINA
jgi:hypothetical protein